MDSARNVITHILSTYFLSYVAFYDVASTIHQSHPSVDRWIVLATS
jgi:hypothetical protein